MTPVLKQIALKCVLIPAFTLFTAGAALAGSSSTDAATVGGAIDEINVLTYATVSSITVVAATGQTDTVVASGTINNNMAGGWALMVMSNNNGILKRGAGGPGNEINYGSVKLVKTSGVLGTALTDPSGQNLNISSGIVAFKTQPGTATSATVDYAFELKVSWDSDPDLMEGTYEDTYTLTLATLS